MNPDIRWSVYKSATGRWIARHLFHVQPHDSWDDAYAYAYRHAQAAFHEVP